MIITLKENADFKKIYKKGKQQISPIVIIYYKKNKLSYNRIGITTSKKIGNAVKRNRAKRVLKESYRLLLMEEQFINDKHFDIVFVARSKTTRVKMYNVKSEMKRQLKKSEIIL